MGDREWGMDGKEIPEGITEGQLIMLNVGNGCREWLIYKMINIYDA